MLGGAGRDETPLWRRERVFFAAALKRGSFLCRGWFVFFCHRSNTDTYTRAHNTHNKQTHALRSALIALEFDLASILDFGGINTGDAEAALRRADKGGMASGPQLRGLVTLLHGADKLKKQIQTAARQAPPGGGRAGGAGGALRPLLSAVARLRPPLALARDVSAAIGEDGEVNESASERVRTTRARVRGLISRAGNALKAFPGEVSEHAGRCCVAAPAGTKIPGGVVLGATPGGGMVFIEPPQVVGLNIELMAARAEAMAAEEAVLWDLSARLMGELADAQAVRCCCCC